MICVGRILAAHIHNTWSRSDKAKIMKLLKEWMREIVRPASCELIPIITPPDGLVVDYAFLILRINGNGFLCGSITLPSVEISFVSIRNPPLLPTIRTECGGWKGILFAGNHR